MTREETIAEGVTVYLGDNREILPTLQLSRVQRAMALARVEECPWAGAGPKRRTAWLTQVGKTAMVTDPPYGIGEAAGKNKSRGLLATARDYGDLEWDNEPAPTWLIELLRETSDCQIIFGGNFYQLPPTSCWLVWDKKVNGDFADCELAWTNLPKAVRRIEWLWNGMIRKGSDVREHPTQKPLGVMAWALDQLPADVKLVCDPFMGSGTTGVAAIQKGIKFVGIEREAAYFDAACERLQEALRAPKLFSEAPAPAPVQEAML